MVTMVTQPACHVGVSADSEDRADAADAADAQDVRGDLGDPVCHDYL